MTRSVKIYFALFFFLVVFGMVMVFNIKVFTVDAPEIQVWKILRAQILNFLIASIGFLTAYLINIETFRSWIKYILLFIFILLLSTYVIGTEVNGSKRWINLYFMMIQPSEFAKIVAVFYLADVICNKRERIGLLQELVYPFGLVSLMVLIIAVADLGTGLIIFLVAVMMLLMGGMRLKYFSVLVVLATIVMTLLIMMKPYRLERIRAFLDPWKYRQTIGYQQVQSEIAMGRGGVEGVGFGNSQRKLKYLPEASTDFIFAIVGEEFGFTGSLIVVLAFMAMFVSGVFFTMTRDNLFYLYVISGFVLILSIQILMNLGVVTSTLPNKGVPLPFISYGGSALLSCSMMVGFIMNAVVAEKNYNRY